MQTHRSFRTGIRCWLTAVLAGSFLLGTPGALYLVAGEDAQSQQNLDATYDQIVSRAIEYLRTRGRNDDGSYSPQLGPAVTAIVTTALLRHGRAVEDPLVAKSLAYLQSFQKPDGGIYRTDSLYANYETCLAIMCFTEANQDGRFDGLLDRAEAYVKKIQHDEGEGFSPDHMSYGGAGYGRHKRPDLSNTSFLIEALQATGNGPEDENMQKALLFVSRCQNHESEYNSAPFAVKNPDGGFYYTCAAGGSSQAPATPDMPEGALRSYASMTYAGLKSMIYAGLDQDDERVQAAWEWIQQNYDLDSNPGMGEAGLYYYYQTFAKALASVGNAQVKDASGEAHDWRADLVRVLAERQQADGSWSNENPRWLEGDPNLVTGYALLALSYCRETLPAGVTATQ